MNYADIFRALADENRVLILDILSGGEKCALDILKGLGISQSTLSHHMKILTDSGLVLKQKSGRKTFYVVSREVADELSEYFSRFASSDVSFSEKEKSEKQPHRKKSEKKPPAPSLKEEKRQTDIWLF